MTSSAINSVNLLAVGDIAFNDQYDRLLDSQGPNYPFARILPLFESADLVLGNLEGPLSTHGPVHAGKCSLRSRPEYAVGLKRAGFVTVSLANNHILDSGQQGLEETRRHLEQAGIGYAGLLEDAEAQRPVLIRRNGLIIGMLAYCDVPIDSPFYFPEANPGVARFVRERAVADVQKLSKEVDCAIVSLHWGTENLEYPSPAQRAAARALIDAGASLVVGHHPHVAQGIERYGKGHIAYSLGNFLFSDIMWTGEISEGKFYTTKIRLRRVNRRSFILRCRINGKIINSIEVIPCLINSALQAVEDHTVRVASRLRRLSAALSRDDYSAIWEKALVRHRHSEVLHEKLAWRRLIRVHRLRPSHLYDLYSSFSSAPKLDDAPEK